MRAKRTSLHSRGRCGHYFSEWRTYSDSQPDFIGVRCLEKDLFFRNKALRGLRGDVTRVEVYDWFVAKSMAYPPDRAPLENAIEDSIRSRKPEPFRLRLDFDGTYKEFSGAVKVLTCPLGSKCKNNCQLAIFLLVPVSEETRPLGVPEEPRKANS